MHILCNGKIFREKYLYLRVVKRFTDDEDFASKIYTQDVPRAGLANRGRERCLSHLR